MFNTGKQALSAWSKPWSPHSEVRKTDRHEERTPWWHETAHPCLGPSVAQQGSEIPEYIFSLESTIFATFFPPWAFNVFQLVITLISLEDFQRKKGGRFIHLKCCPPFWHFQLWIPFTFPFHSLVVVSSHLSPFLAHAFLVQLKRW